MAIRSGFFNSVNHDRVYGPDDFGEVLGGMITDGVYYGYLNSFKTVRAKENYKIDVQSGKAWFDNVWVVNDSTTTLTISQKSSQDRIDLIVLEINKHPDIRKARFVVVKGEPARDPKWPDTKHTDTVTQYVIAAISVRANSGAGPEDADVIYGVGNPGFAPFSQMRHVSQDISKYAKDMLFYAESITTLPLRHIGTDGVSSPPYYTIMPSPGTVKNVIMARAWPLDAAIGWNTANMVDWKVEDNKVKVALYTDGTKDQSFSCKFIVIYSKE